MTEPTDNSFLRLESLGKTFGDHVAVNEANLHVNQGEFISLLGPSGCGKTTILRMIAGFEVPTMGRIHVDGRDVTNLRPNQRQIGMVFQSYALFPNMNVSANIGFGLKVAGESRAAIAERVREMLDLIGLEGHEKRYPFELSGGQQQRVALARALAARPTMLLLDEPLSALDAKIRVSLRQQIKRIQRELGITTVFVTHDQEEALSISDRVVVMNAGRIEQVGTPFEIYNHPASRFVATFVGTLNLVEAQVVDAAAARLAIGNQTFSLPSLPEEAAAQQTVSLALRPEAVTIGKHDHNDVHLEGVVSEVAFLGSVIRIHVDVDGETISLDTFNDQRTPPPAVDARVSLSLAGQDVLVLDA